MKQLVTLHRQALHTASTPGPDDDKSINIKLLRKEEKTVIVEAGVTEDARLVLFLFLALLQQPSLVPLLLLHSISLASLLLSKEDLHVAQNPSVCGHFPPFLHMGLHQGQTQLQAKLEAHLLIPRVQPLLRQ